MYPEAGTADPVTTCEYEIPSSGMILRSDHIRESILDEEIAACAAGLDGLYGR